ncbi:MAG: exopolyphosphatase, partial [Deltaproteobacteria bacterium]|nr:exopolyphosphatase [Deltaproteobacteria bacterium]
MRIVTRPDFDGIVCAALIYDAETIDQPVKWVEPSEMQQGKVDIQKGDIIANLPYHEKCSIWFDHHYSNIIKTQFEGLFEIAPSAAGLVHRYYQGRLKRDYDDLIRQTDRIDAADLTLDEVLHPEKYIFVLLSMTISGRQKTDEPYWNLLVELIRRHDIETIMANREIARRCKMVKAANTEYKIFLEKYTRMEKMVSITDFRSLD